MTMPPDDKAEILAAIAASEERTTRRINEAYGKLDGALRGDLDGGPGILSRLATLEKLAAKMDRAICAAILAVVSAIGHAIWQVITHRSP